MTVSIARFAIILYAIWTSLANQTWLFTLLSLLGLAVCYFLDGAIQYPAEMRCDTVVNFSVVAVLAIGSIIALDLLGSTP